MPQDVRLTPDGRTFVVADMLRNGVWLIDASTLTVRSFLPTGKGAHGIYPSRDASELYVSNRDEGTVSVKVMVWSSSEQMWSSTLPDVALIAATMRPNAARSRTHGFRLRA